MTDRIVGQPHPDIYGQPYTVIVMAVNHTMNSVRQQAKYASDLIKRGKPSGAWGVFPREVQHELLAKLCTAVENQQRGELRKVESVFVLCWVLAGAGAAMMRGGEYMIIVASAWAAAHALRWWKPRYMYESLFSGRTHEDNEREAMLNTHPLPKPVVSNECVQEIVQEVVADCAFEKVPGRALLEGDAAEWGLVRWVDSKCGPGAAAMVGALARQGRNESATLGELMRVLRQVEGVAGSGL